MSFQTVFDRAETISIITRPTVATSITRNNVVRSVHRGGDSWRFSVTLPDGIPWSELRPVIAEMEKLGTHTQQDNIKINNAGYNDWLLNYQGDSENISGFIANIGTDVDYLTLGGYPAGPNLSNGDYTFRAGDVIELPLDAVYIVAEDVIYPQPVVPLNRAVTAEINNYNLILGPEVAWDLICVEMPQWTIFQRNQVSWSGAFVFYEVR